MEPGLVGSMFRRAKCKVGLHTGAWGRDAPGHCDFTRICDRCGRRSIRARHAFGEWNYEADGRCNQVRTCSVCSESESSTVHEWGEPSYASEGSCDQLVICRRCRAWQGSPVVHQWQRLSESPGLVGFRCLRCGKTRTVKAMPVHERTTGPALRSATFGPTRPDADVAPEPTGGAYDAHPPRGANVGGTRLRSGAESVAAEPPLPPVVWVAFSGQAPGPAEADLIGDWQNLDPTGPAGLGSTSALTFRQDGSFQLTETPGGGSATIISGTWTAANGTLNMSEPAGSPVSLAYARDHSYLLLLTAWSARPALWSRKGCVFPPLSPRGAAWARALSSGSREDMVALAGAGDGEVRQAFAAGADQLSPGEPIDDVALLAVLGEANGFREADAGVVRDLAGAVGAICREAVEFKAARAGQIRTRWLNVCCWAAGIETDGIEGQGQWQEAVSVAATWLAWLDAYGQQEKWFSLATAAAEARLKIGRPVAAQGWLKFAERGEAQSDAEMERHRNVSRLAAEATPNPRGLRVVHSGPDLAAIASMSAQVRRLEQLLPLVVAANRDRARELLEALKAGLEEDPPNVVTGGPEWDREIAALFGETQESRSQAQVRQDVRYVQGILTDPVRGWNADELVVCQETAERARAAALLLNSADDQNHMAWAISVCQRRLDDHAAAVGTLISLWHELEDQRNNTKEPLERAGSFKKFPHLFVVLAAELMQTGRDAELFEVIEAGKGRLLADTVLTRTADALVAKVGSASPAGSHGVSNSPGLSSAAESLKQRDYQVPALPSNAHLLTFLVDDDCVYAALVAADGSRHAAAVAIGRDDLRRYAKHVDPSTWGQRSGGFGHPPNPDDLPDFLAPLVSWLEPLVAEGVLAAGDHICYSPDEELYLIPLQLLMFNRRPLVDSFSVSRTHSLSMELDERSGHAGHRLDRACVVVVPALDDKPEKTTSLKRIADRLAEMVPCEAVAGAAATVDAIVVRDLSDRVVHFACHGTFPPFEDADVNPFQWAGLLLATGSGLPLLKARGRDGGLLSPERVAELRLTGSHVTTQACSTGLAREGSAGDALGLELAFLLSGASSLLTTHWDVPVDPAGEFCVRFYRAWLLDGLTRAEAWREAATSMKDEGRPAHEWAAFSLSGQWQ
jgi:hypothetical protein